MPPPERCPRLGEPTGESVQVYGVGCPSEQCLTAVWACALYGRCVPLPRGTSLADDTISRCLVCPDRPVSDR